MKLVKIDDVYINLDHIVSIECDDVFRHVKCDFQVKIIVRRLSAESVEFFRPVSPGEAFSAALDRFIEELRPWVEI